MRRPLLVTWLAKLQSTLRGLLSFIPKSGMTHVWSSIKCTTTLSVVSLDHSPSVFRDLQVRKENKVLFSFPKNTEEENGNGIRGASSR
jgi:hypothetical protein